MAWPGTLIKPPIAINIIAKWDGREGKKPVHQPGCVTKPADMVALQSPCVKAGQGRRGIDEGM
eukprot:6858255-Prorocentrum_lima.AAC.1